MPNETTHPRVTVKDALQRLDEATTRLEAELGSTAASDPTRIAALTAVVNGRAAAVNARIRRNH